MSQNIQYVSSLKSMEEMKKLVTIALKAHGNNPSPVDIKQELAALDAENLMTMNEQISRLIEENKTTQQP